MENEVVLSYTTNWLQITIGQSLPAEFLLCFVDGQADYDLQQDVETWAQGLGSSYVTNFVARWVLPIRLSPLRCPEPAVRHNVNLKFLAAGSRRLSRCLGQ